MKGKKEKKELTAKEVSSRGGKSTLKKYGSKHFSELAKKSAKKRKNNKKKMNYKNSEHLMKTIVPVIELVDNQIKEHERLRRICIARKNKGGVRYFTVGLKELNKSKDKWNNFLEKIFFSEKKTLWMK